MPGGRPRKHPIGTTSTDRSTDSRAALRSAGGAIKHFALSAEAVRRLAELRRRGRDPSDVAVIERLLAEATDGAEV